MTKPAGRSLVILATLGRVDREGDLVLPNSLANGPEDLAAVSRHGHSVILDGEQPVGEARVYEEAGQLRAEITYYPDPE